MSARMKRFSSEEWGAPFDACSWPMLFEVGFDDVDQFFGRQGLLRTWLVFAIDDVRTHVVFDDFSHQSLERALARYQRQKRRRAILLGFQRLFDGIDLAPDAPHPVQKLLFFVDDMRHASRVLYPQGVYQVAWLIRLEPRSWLHEKTKLNGSPTWLLLELSTIYQGLKMIDLSKLRIPQPI